MTHRSNNKGGDMRTATTIQYVAEPKHVQEVTLIGTTDLRFWSDYLNSEGLAPLRYVAPQMIVGFLLGA